MCRPRKPCRSPPRGSGETAPPLHPHVARVDLPPFRSQPRQGLAQLTLNGRLTALEQISDVFRTTPAGLIQSRHKSNRVDRDESMMLVTNRKQRKPFDTPTVTCGE